MNFSVCLLLFAHVHFSLQLTVDGFAIDKMAAEVKVRAPQNFSPLCSLICCFFQSVSRIFGQFKSVILLEQRLFIVHFLSPFIDQNEVLRQT